MLKKLLFILMTFTIIFWTQGAQAQNSSNQKKIALLFLTRSDLNHADLWQHLLEKYRDKYTIYIHSKDPMTHPFFKKYRVSTIVPTSWSIHVKAWQVLIQEALKDPDNEKFVFLSEACIPLYNLSHIYDVLMRDNFTHMNYAKPWWPIPSPRDIVELDPQYRFGNSEWMILNRKHCEIVASDDTLIHFVATHESDQESYFGCLFSYHDVLNEVVNHSYTYVNWDQSVTPWLFYEASKKNNRMIKSAYSSGALFARKFAKEYPTRVLLKMIKNH